MKSGPQGRFAASPCVGFPDRQAWVRISSNVSLEQLASTAPDTIVYSIAIFSNNACEIQHITAHTLAKAVDKTAWWLYNQFSKHDGNLNEEKNVGQNVKPQEPPKIQALGYIGPRKHALQKKQDRKQLTVRR